MNLADPSFEKSEIDRIASERRIFGQPVSRLTTSRMKSANFEKKEKRKKKRDRQDK